MKKISLFLFLIHQCIVFADQSLSITPNSSTSEKMNLLVVPIGSSTRVQEVAKKVAELLSCSKQKRTGFTVAVKTMDQFPKKMDDIKKENENGFPLIVFLSATPKNNSIEWRLYDATQATMISGKKYRAQNDSEEYFSTMIANILWKELTGNQGVFGSCIAYCIDMDRIDNKIIRKICIADMCGTVLREVGAYSSSKLAPRWSPNMQSLFFSECTHRNVRLMRYNFENKKIYNAINANGVNLVPSFSPDGKTMVFCSSYKGTSQIYKGILDQKLHTWHFNPLTNNNGTNISPILLENGDVIFCSDFQTKLPQLFYYTAATGEYERLTKGPSSTSPSYNPKTNTIAFSRTANGALQIFLLDLNTKNITQLTNDAGDKEESSWSPCGNYLAYVVDYGKTSRIAVHNIQTKERYYITKQNMRCTYPSWSPGIVQLI